MPCAAASVFCAAAEAFHSTWLACAGTAWCEPKAMRYAASVEIDWSARSSTCNVPVVRPARVMAEPLFSFLPA